MVNMVAESAQAVLAQAEAVAESDPVNHDLEVALR